MRRSNREALDRHSRRERRYGRRSEHDRRRQTASGHRETVETGSEGHWRGRRVKGRNRRGERTFTRWDGPHVVEEAEGGRVSSEEEIDFSVEPDELVYIGEEERGASEDGDCDLLIEQGSGEQVPEQSSRASPIGSAEGEASGSLDSDSRQVIEKSLETEGVPQDDLQEVAARVVVSDTRQVLEESGSATQAELGASSADTRVVLDESSSSRECEVCGKTARKVFRHVLATHLPWFFSPETACWSCEKQFATMSSLLHHQRVKRCAMGWDLELWVASMRTLVIDIAGLLGVNWREIHLEVPRISTPMGAVREALLMVVEESLHSRVVRVHLDPPNCPAAVLAPKAIVELLRKLNTAQLQRVRSASLSRGIQVTLSQVDIVDAHCHTRQLYQQARDWREDGWEVVPATVGREGVLVCNRVFGPADWNSKVSMPQGFRVLKTVGVHPRLADGTIDWQLFERKVRSTECVAVGECGLDATAAKARGKSRWEPQEHVLTRQIMLAKEVCKPLVLHVRGTSSESTEVLLDRVLGLCSAVLDREHKVYVHCFTGSIKSLFKWRSAFPGAMFGITWRSTEVEGFEDIGRRAPMDLLALESDAPYLSPMEGRVNRPQWIVKQAQRIADLRNLPVEVVLRRCNMNTARFFGFF